MTPPRLTAREREVCCLLVAHRTTKQIAAYLGVNEQRVRFLIKRVATKLDVDRTGDVRVAIALRWREAA